MHVLTSDAVMGCIIAGAIGDSVGGCNERSALALSDDTQLTLATCEAIVQNRGRVDPATVAAVFLKWYRGHALSGLGAATLKALRDLDVGAHWALCGARGERAAGNGAAMRIAPLAFVLDPDIPQQRTLIRDVCRITHHSDEAYIGALAVIYAIRNQPRPEQMLDIAAQLPDSQVRDRLQDLSTWSGHQPFASIAERHGTDGHVATTVPLALLLAARMLRDGFLPTLQSAANLSGDIDTLCAIAAQVAGAQLGYARLPCDWLNHQAVSQATGVAKAFAQQVISTQ